MISQMWFMIHEIPMSGLLDQDSTPFVGQSRSHGRNLRVLYFQVMMSRISFYTLRVFSYACDFS